MRPGLVKCRKTNIANIRLTEAPPRLPVALALKKLLPAVVSFPRIGTTSHFIQDLLIRVGIAIMAAAMRLEFGRIAVSNILASGGRRLLLKIISDPVMILPAAIRDLRAVADPLSLETEAPAVPAREAESSSNPRRLPSTPARRLTRWAAALPRPTAAPSKSSPIPSLTAAQ